MQHSYSGEGWWSCFVLYWKLKIAAPTAKAEVLSCKMLSNLHVVAAHLIIFYTIDDGKHQWQPMLKLLCY
jgi:hypothetical protein